MASTRHPETAATRHDRTHDGDNRNRQLSATGRVAVALIDSQRARANRFNAAPDATTRTRPD